MANGAAVRETAAESEAVPAFHSPVQTRRNSMRFSASPSVSLDERPDSQSARTRGGGVMALGRTCLPAVVVSMLVSGTPLRSGEPLVEVPFDLYQRHLIVAKGSIGRLNGLSLLIDTGTIPSMVDRRIARTLHLQAESSMLVAFGQQVPVQSALVDGFRIGSLRSGQVPVGVGDLSVLARRPHRRHRRARRAGAHELQHRLSKASAHVRARRSRARSRAAGDRLAVCDGEDDYRRRAGSIARRHRQQRSGAVQVADARGPVRRALER